MEGFDIREAKSRFSEIIDRVARGESIVICKSGKPVARVIGYSPDSVRASSINRLGFLTGGTSRVPDDFDQMGGVEIETIFGIEE